MKTRINVNSMKNAMGTVFLLAAAFFVCSTLVSMRSVFADPIVNPNASVQKSGRQSPRSASSRTSRGTVSRATTARATSNAKSAVLPSRGAVSRGSATRTVSARPVASSRTSNAVTPANRTVVSRGNTATARPSASSRAVRARTGVSTARVGTTGSVMTATRASTGNQYTYLNSKLYTGSYSNIIDSSTGLISADAYSNCLDAYYTCMDEICTARSDTKGRCSCAGRAVNFLDAEEKLEQANEELIKLSGQLSLLIATKGKGDDLASAFSLTDAEKVMNCVSYKETIDKYGASSPEARNWCSLHNIYSGTGGEVSTCSQPSYCSASGNNFQFDIKNIDGSSSDIVAQLKAWADAKDLAKQYSTENTGNVLSAYTTVSGIVDGLAGITTATEKDTSDLDTLANTWGYDLFQYAHNNVCGRVLDSCFNGIYETCGNPGNYTTTDKGNVSIKCANGATTSNCPFNYNSYISVKKTDGVSTGDVVLSDRSTVSANQSASCFGYATTATTTTTRGTTTTSSDPYAALRGPVADARRSIIQKYLLDANAACDTYGAALRQTAQNINYQKIAAEQALQQKRLEFKQEEDEQTLADATEAANNFDECLSEIMDCYETQYNNKTAGGSTWTLARVKTYCAQIAQVPHCYETMICNPSTAQFHAVIDKPDNQTCFNSQDFRQNTCRNIVTISEILNPVSNSPVAIAAEGNGSSIAMREKCLIDAGVQEIRDWTPAVEEYVDCTLAQLSGLNAAKGYNETANKDSETCAYITKCNSGYLLRNGQCVNATYDCTSEIPNAAYATKSITEDGRFSTCTVQSCQEHYSQVGNACVADTVPCSAAELAALNADSGVRTWDGDTLGACVINGCAASYIEDDNGKCVPLDCKSEIPHAIYALYSRVGGELVCTLRNCEEGYAKSGNECVCASGYIADDNDVCISADCTDTIDGAESATYTRASGRLLCVLETCRSGYTKSGNKCIAE